MESGKLYSEEDIRLKLPCNALIAGPPLSGKSTLVETIIKYAEELFNPPPKSILYCYGEYDKRIHNLQSMGVTVTAGIPSESLIESLEKPALIFYDDMMLDVNEKYMLDLFTRKSHHKNLGVFFLTQNLFSSTIKVARMNCHYIFILRSLQASLHIRTLGSHLFPGQLKYFMDAYHKACDKAYKYFLIDSHPTTPQELRLRSNIMPGEQLTVYLPKA